LNAVWPEEKTLAMLHHTHALFVSLVAAALMCGCHSPPPRTVITMAAHGQEITVPLGARIEIHLPQTPSTGFQWVSESPPEDPILALIGDTYVADPADDGVVGSGGERSLAYDAHATGYEVIAWTYRRPWLEKVASDRQFRIVIHVDGDVAP